MEKLTVLYIFAEKKKVAGKNRQQGIRNGTEEQGPSKGELAGERGLTQKCQWDFQQERKATFKNKRCLACDYDANTVSIHFLSRCELVRLVLLAEK